MKMKLPDLSGKVIIIKSDQEEARKCYESSLKTKRGVFMVFERPPSVDTTMIEATPAGSMPDEATPEADTLMEEGPNDTAPVQDNSRDQQAANVVEREIGGKTFKLGRLLSQEEQEEVAEVISRHLDAFTWSASDMPGIDPDFLCHHLSMDATVRPVHQRRRKFNEERQLVVREETQKLLSVGHIREIQYPEWLANVVLVKKANGNWRMCVDFTYLNKACPCGTTSRRSALVNTRSDSHGSPEILSSIELTPSRIFFAGRRWVLRRKNLQQWCEPRREQASRALVLPLAPAGRWSWRVLRHNPSKTRFSPAHLAGNPATGSYPCDDRKPRGTRTKSLSEALTPYQSSSVASTSRLY